MNTFKLTFLFPFFCFLTACGTVTPASMPALTPTPSPTSVPTVTMLPTETVIATETFGPSSKSLPSITLEGLRMAYIFNGNLYVQDNGQQPVKLTQADGSLIFSDDGQKIVFKKQGSLFLINADGSGKQPLVAQDILQNLGYTEPTNLGEPLFVPATHQVLFQTYNPSSEWPDPNHDLFIVDTDSAQIRQLLPPGEAENFAVSPLGKLIAIQSPTAVKIIDLEGRVVHPDLLTIQPNWQYEPIFLDWARDAGKSTLFVEAPIGGEADPTDGPEPLSIWKLSLDSSPATEIRFDPNALDTNISPDGRWVVYKYYDIYGPDEKLPPMGPYLGNLINGSSQFLESPGYPESGKTAQWSPNSEHFIFSYEGEMQMIVNVQGEITHLPKDSYLLGWIDDNRYIYSIHPNHNVFMGEVGNKDSVMVMNLPDNYSNLTFVYVKPK